MKHFKLWLLMSLMFCIQPLLAQVTNVTAIQGLLNRIGGEGTADRMAVKIDPGVAENGKEVFVIKSEAGKPCIVGSTSSAVTTGINWYLNHNAHVNLTWNQLTTDLSKVTFPVPSSEEKHVCNADYRYYLNYCTFSYSMSTWTWKRWEQEIDWMALHGINIPLQIIGLDVVWYNLLTKDYGYSHEEADAFIAGPCFQAWWGMNNLEGWGGPNPEWWYKRQESLAKKILARQRELGIEPVLPGYSGMVPSNFTQKTGKAANNQGGWCGFTRPFILDPNSPAFAEVSAKYYTRLEEVMGKSDYYSMDPFHEGANTSGIDVPSAYKAIGNEMLKVNANAKWVIQQWQWGWHQYAVLDQMAKGQLVVLDLFSDAHTHFGAYKGHDAVYCALSNFGGRTGLFGRLTKVMNEYFNEKTAHNNVKGIGATPEAIEQVPVLYDALFELAWRDKAPDAKEWLKDYVHARYGVANNTAAETAWEKIRNSALNCETGLQGPHEAVVCGRPWWNIGAVSSWGGTGIFYNVQDVADAAYRLMNSGLDGQNYSYDLVDFTRQALTDYGKSLLAAVDQVRNNADKTDYKLRRDAYLQLILDLDELLNTNENFMLGRWTQMARGIADEVKGTTIKDKEWLELNNARTLITTWGARNNSEGGGLRDYSYREWGGMMKDFYYKRWKAFFDQNDNGISHESWFDMEWKWAHDGSVQYNTQTKGISEEVAKRLFGKYFVNFKADENNTFHIYRYMETNAKDVVKATALRGSKFHFNVENLPKDVKATIGVDFNNNGVIDANETSSSLDINIPADAVTGKVLAQLALSDGTVFKFELTQKDEIKNPRTVSVKSAKETEGKVAIEGTDALSVNNTNEVTIKATPVSGYDFINWTNAAGEVVSKANPYTYFGAEAAEFTANFIINKWGTPEEDLKEYGDLKGDNQYLKSIGIIQNGADEYNIYSENQCPATLCHSTSSFNATMGSKFIIHWKGGTLHNNRLSAYIDLNSDGDFEDEGEFLTVIGNKGQGNNGVLNDYKLEVLLPYNMPEGITHVRLRFDGAWQTSDLNKYDAKPAKAKTLRMVYDLPVNITTKAATPCTVTVNSADEKLGTVDANGQSLTYTYGVGEEVVLRCWPVKGFYIEKWTDKYGRAVPKAWMDGNFLRFHAPESNTYTAHFTNKKTDIVAFNDWEAQMEEKSDGLNLTKITKVGTGALDLSKSDNIKPITGIAPNFFHSQATLSKVILPRTLRDMSNLAYENSVKGDGNQNSFTLSNTIKSDEPWKLIMNVKGDGSSFNEWGSCLLATGTNPFANSYNGGFQLYWKTDGRLMIKSSNSTDKYWIDNIENSFTIEFQYDGEGVFTAVLTRTDGTQETLTMNEKLNDFNQLCYGLPNGIEISQLAIYYERFVGDPFVGCSNLDDIEVAEGNPLFSDKNGVLFNGDQTQLLYYPKHRIHSKYFTLKNKATHQYVTATPPANAEGNIIANDWNNKERRTATTETVDATGIWQLNTDNKLYHFNSKGYMGGKAGNGGEGQILEIIAAAQWSGKYTLEEFAPFNADLTSEVSFKLPENFYLSSKDNALKLTATAGNDTKWELTEIQAIPVAVPSAGWTTVSFPAATLVPAAEEATVYQVTGMNGVKMIKEALTPGTILATGEGVLVHSNKATVSFPISYEEGKALSSNILKGAQARRSGIADRYEFTQQGQSPRLVARTGETQNNSAYLLKSVTGDKELVLFEDHKISIDDLKFMTLYIDYAVTIPEGVTAYAAKEVKNGEVVLAPIAKGGEVLPAKTAAIIYSDIAKENYPFAYSETSGSTNVPNLLKGTLEDTFVAPVPGKKVYVMGLHNGELKMMKAKLNYDAEGNKDGAAQTHFLNRGNKAYLEVAAEAALNASALRFSFDDEQTSIENLELNHGEKEIYDFQGRKILHVTAPGLYIINGHKTYIK